MLLELVVETGADGLETMTPPGMGGNCDLRGACGHGRFLQFKWEADHAATEFKKMAEIE